jgi:nucleoside-diphosphate-sugar epimerase
MKILVTGGAGYIGSVLVPLLISNGHHVTVIDNLMFNQSALLSECISEKFDFVKGDVRDVDLMRKLILDKDIIIPLAALVGAPLCEMNKLGAVSTNQDSIEMMCNLIEDYQKVIMPVTNSGYGIGEKGQFCTENSPLNPISLYGKTKVEAESFIMKRNNSISLRLATVFGASPRMRTDLLVNDFVYRSVKDSYLVIFEGQFKRNYIHIRDVVSAFLFCINNFEKLKSNVFNLGLEDANLSKLELAEKIKQYIPSLTYIESAIGNDPDKRDYVVSNKKILDAGFKFSFTIDDGIKELIKVYKIISKNSYSNI